MGSIPGPSPSLHEACLKIISGSEPAHKPFITRGGSFPLRRVYKFVKFKTAQKNNSITTIYHDK